MTTVAVSDLLDVVDRVGNKYVVQQTNLTSAILDTGLLEQVKLAKGIPVVNIVLGAKQSSQFIGDGDTLPSGDSSIPVQGQARPRALFSRISFGRIAAAVGMSGDEAADQLDVQLQGASEELSQKLARSLFDSKLAVAEGGLQQWTGTAVGSRVSITVKDGSGYREGQVIQFASGSVAPKVLVESFSEGTVGDATYGGGTVVLKTLEALTSTNFTGSSVDPYLNGSRTSANVDSTNAVSSFVLANTSGSTLHGIAWNNTGWVGNEYSSFGTLDHEKLGGRMSQLMNKGGLEASALFCNPLVYTGLAVAGLSAGATIFGIASAGNGARKDVGSSMDKYASAGLQSDPNQRVHGTLTCRGKPVLADSNCPVNKIVLHQSAYTKLHRWAGGEFKPEKTGDTIGRTSFDHDIQLAGYAELVFKKRKAQGIISGITQI